MAIDGFFLGPHARLIATLSTFLFLGLSLFLRHRLKTFIFPASLFALAWFAYTFIPLILLSDIPINPLAILYLFICIFAFSLGALPFNWSKAYGANVILAKHRALSYDNKLMHSIFSISIISSFVSSTFMLISAGFDLKSIFLNMMETSHTYAHMRGHGKISHNVFGSLAIFFTYLSVITGSLISISSKSNLKKFAFLILAFFPVLYIMFSQSAKLAMFYSLGFYIAALLLIKIQSIKLDLFNKKLFFYSSVFVLSFAPLLSISFLSRSTPEELINYKNKLLFVAKSYTLAQPYSFSDFFSSYLGQPSITNFSHDLHSHGAYTFTSLVSLFGIEKTFPPGTYYDNFNYNDTIATNIYTIFRGLINDFGAIGTIVYMFITGLIAHAIFYLLLTKKNAFVACSSFLVMIVYIQGTYLASIFMARNMYLIVLTMSLIFFLNNRLAQKIQGHIAG